MDGGLVGVAMAGLTVTAIYSGEEVDDVGRSGANSVYVYFFVWLVLKPMNTDVISCGGNAREPPL